MKLANNIAAFVNFFGMQDPDLVMSFATVPWESDNERNAFLNELVDINNGNLIGGQNE